jgi:hypothetical protein
MVTRWPGEGDAHWIRVLACGDDANSTADDLDGVGFNFERFLGVKKKTSTSQVRMSATVC